MNEKETPFSHFDGAIRTLHGIVAWRRCSFKGSAPVNSTAATLHSTCGCWRLLSSVGATSCTLVGDLFGNLGWFGNKNEGDQRFATLLQKCSWLFAPT